MQLRPPVGLAAHELQCISHRLSDQCGLVAGRRKFGDFLAEYAAPMRGSYVDVDTGQVLGSCENMTAVTYGQRPSLGGSPERWE